MRRLFAISIIILLLIGALPLFNVSVKNISSNHRNKPTAVIVWEKTWDIGSEGEAYDVYVENGYIYVTGSTDPNFDSGDIFLLKYDLNGNLIWNRTWDCEKYGVMPFGHGPYRDIGYGLYVYRNYVYVAGETVTVNANEFLLLKYDEEGNLIWNVTWGRNSIDTATDLFIYNDSIFVVGNSLWEGHYEAVLLKYDLDGNLLWSWVSEGDNKGNTTASSVYAYNGYVYVAGIKTVNDVEHGFIQKFATNGSLVWSKILTNNSSLNSVFVEDNSIYITGWVNYENVYIARLNKDGDMIWDLILNGSSVSDLGSGIFAVNNGLYVVGSLHGNGFISRLDTNGSILWNFSNLKTGNMFNSLYVNGGYIYVVGGKDKTGHGAILIKFDEDSDGDGLGNHQEESIKTDPFDWDTDNDGYSDYEEVKAGTNPLSPMDNIGIRYGAMIIILLIIILGILVYKKYS